jgi:hypothetical protein
VWADWLEFAVLFDMLDPMTTQILDRIVELWPDLPEAARADLLKRAEALAADAVAFTTEELAGIERDREDFKHGRTLSAEQFDSNMDAFMDGLRQKSARAP